MSFFITGMNIPAIIMYVLWIGFTFGKAKMSNVKSQTSS